MALAKLTDAQRQAALKKAAEARQKRAALKKDIKAGRAGLREVLSRSNDPIVDRMKVKALLQSLPGVGKARAIKYMNEFKISDTRRIQGLGSKQREQLLNKLA